MPKPDAPEHPPAGAESAPADTPPSARSRADTLKALAPLGLILLAATGIAVAISQFVTLEDLRIHRQNLRAILEAHPVLVTAGYCLTYIFGTLIMFPGMLWMTILGGILFGLPAGAALSVTSATVGATSLFLFARSAFGRPLHARAGPFIARVSEGFRADSASWMLALRFLPLLPYPVANLAPALLGARLPVYVVTTFIGLIPSISVYSAVGASAGAAFDAGQTPDVFALGTSVAPAMAALAALALAPVLVRRLMRARRRP